MALINALRTATIFTSSFDKAVGVCLDLESARRGSTGVRGGSLGHGSTGGDDFLASLIFADEAVAALFVDSAGSSGGGRGGGSTGGGGGSACEAVGFPHEWSWLSLTPTAFDDLRRRDRRRRRTFADASLCDE